MLLKLSKKIDYQKLDENFCIRKYCCEKIKLKLFCIVDFSRDVFDLKFLTSAKRAYQGSWKWNCMPKIKISDAFVLATSKLGDGKPFFFELVFDVWF